MIVLPTNSTVEDLITTLECLNPEKLIAVENPHEALLKMK